jgi:hypothetical protein
VPGTACHWTCNRSGSLLSGCNAARFLRSKVIVLQLGVKEQITFSNGGNHEKATITYQQQKQRPDGDLRAHRQERWHLALDCD